METIPLRPVFQNQKFKALKPAQKFFVINAVYKLCTEGEAGKPIPNNLRYHLQCSNSTYDRYSSIFRDVLIEVMPTIAKIKNNKTYQTIKAHKSNRDKPKKHKDNQGYGELVEPIIENQAPILPQLSRESEILNRNRILNERQFKMQPWMNGPPKPHSKPMLTEKPK